MKYSLIITAGGTSSRYGNTNKLLEKINGKEVIKYTVDAFLNEVDEIVISANESIINILTDYFKDFDKIKIIKGGKTRQESVYNGLQIANCDYVLIHDGARPILTKEIIKNVKTSVQEKKAVSVMTKTIDTIKEVSPDGKIIKTLDRSKLYNTQTPQAFEFNLIKTVHEKLSGQNFTDDAGMVEALGYDVYIVDGDYRNIKITTKSDIDIAKNYL
ncbi:2-C-methyl-D-erythritol 4-phosphate cytidylyltransferase [bacterium]|nr:2-C-methyl-D-erythritol 4-phosphate cytidylyltransferase [bacterium]